MPIDFNPTELIVAEYRSLRSEVIARIGIGQNLVSLTLVVTGVFLSTGLQPKISASVLLIYPIIAFFLATGWTFNDARTGQIANYIRQIEDKYHVIGWGNHLEKVKAKVPLPSRLIGLLSASGVFVTTQFIAILLVCTKMPFSTSEWILFAIDLVFIVCTIVILRTKSGWGQANASGK
jgi:putative flippase GtrA